LSTQQNNRKQHKNEEKFSSKKKCCIDKNISTLHNLKGFSLNF
jgi:hypothetical protein